MCVYAIFYLCITNVMFNSSQYKINIRRRARACKQENIALVPLATPLLAGPGAITAVLVWRQNIGYYSETLALLLMIILSCILVYLTFYFAQVIKNFLGIGGIRVFTRIFGLLLSVIAVQFNVQGIQQI